MLDANDDEKVIVKITNWHKKSNNPTGKVVEVLGKIGENDVEMHAILAEFGLPSKFDIEIENAANKIKDTITDYDYKTRTDFREITTFTIDPEDAKDFDDALSIEYLENNNYRIGIHIADVTNYLHEGSILDNEAFNRATSVYLVDRVVPMLPERLSNFLCSLRPNEEKLCFSVIVEMNDNADIINYEICKTIINSDKRFTYDEAQQVIENESGEFCNELLTLNKLAKLLRKERFRKGAFNFEHKEVKFKLDENAAPIGVYFKESKDSNNLIEEFMLLANKKVAEFIGKEKKLSEFVYRIHDEPNPEKLGNFAEFIKKFGYSINYSSNISLAKSMGEVIENISGKPEQNIIENLAVKAMSKAIYTTNNIGHYGLAFDYYTHFTSPIRRYPDVLVHRLLFSYLKKQKTQINDLEAMCKHCSIQEQQAAMAERSSIKYKQVEFLQDKVGLEFEGVINGVTEWGLFVELKENMCEGLVHISTLKDDYYIYDNEEHRIFGKSSGLAYTLGDSVNVIIKNVNLQKKQIDFELI